MNYNSSYVQPNQWFYLDFEITLSLCRLKVVDAILQPAVLMHEIRPTTMSKWQDRWTTETAVAGWTRRLLPPVVGLAARPSGCLITFHLAQALTGHRAFNEYLHQFGIIASSECAHCKSPVNDVEHTIFVCPQWNDLRMTIRDKLNRSVAASDVQMLLCSDGTNPLTPGPPVLDASLKWWRRSWSKRSRRNVTTAGRCPVIDNIVN